MNHKTLVASFTIVLVALFAAVLLLFTPDAAASQVGPCADQSIASSPHFVWGVALDDPDGGLVTRVGPGVGSARIGVLAPRQGVWLTGQCSTSTTGSLWYQISNRPVSETAWVSGNFLRQAEVACLRDHSQLTGFAIASDRGVAFAHFGYSLEHYSFVPAQAVVFGNCVPTLAVQPQPPFVPNYVPPTPPPYYSPEPYYGPVPVFGPEPYYGPVPVFGPEPYYGTPPVPAPYVGPPPLFHHLYGGEHPRLVVCG